MTQPSTGLAQLDELQLLNCAEIFAAMADSKRLELLIELYHNGESCVHELAERTGDKPNTVSMRLKKLYSANLVNKRRDAKHMFYSLSDDHVITILKNTLDHAAHSS